MSGGEVLDKTITGNQKSKLSIKFKKETSKFRKKISDNKRVIKGNIINFLLKNRLKAIDKYKYYILIIKDPMTYKSAISKVINNITNNIKKIYTTAKNPKLLLSNFIKEVRFRYSRFVGTRKHQMNMFYLFKYIPYRDNLISGFRTSVKFVLNHKKSLSISTAVITFLFSGLLIYNANVGYEVVFNGQDIGIVKDQAVMNKAVGVVTRELSQWYDKEMVFPKEIKFEKTFIDKDNLLSNVDETVNALYGTDIELSINGAVIVINDEEVVTLTSKDEAEEVMNQVLEPYVSVNSNEELIGEPVVKEDYEIVESLVNFADIKEVENAVKLIGQGTEEMQYYKVNKGDTSWDIAVNRGVNISQIETANPDMDITNLHDGDILNLSVAKPYLTVETQKEVTIEESISYGTQYENDSSIYVGKKKVIKEGIKGTNKIIALISYENGEEISKDILSEEVTKEPVDEIVAKGTKALPPAMGTGRFMMPTSGRISAINKAGTHAGGRAIDIANSRGTAVYASDSGTVISASYRGSYGNQIVIDHGNGYTTRYAHLSAYGVSVGDRVTKGQYIAAMGSTGRSTGPHLHFEIMINGNRQRIVNYFGYISLGRHVSP